MNYKYESYPSDPYGLRVYTLSNGLRVYLSRSNDEPRIKTRIVVKAGASYDPDDATGLAHYVEHMMFKGTDLIGALNREKEASLISKIKNKYEELYLAETTEIVNTINRDIDTLSRAASLEAVPGELDKLYSIMGCRSTNARTGFEETVYENDIPATELERWVSLEKERFSSPVLRLFPPELEVVYEEFNQSQDDDISRAFDKLLSNLFPGHPYGRAGILGKGEHLKKPSMEKIENFLNTWYVPDNMALILTGDFDFDYTIDIINKYWGNFKAKSKIIKREKLKAQAISCTSSTIYGSDSPFVIIGYRFDGAGSKDELYLTMLDMIMSNNQAGLLDLNLVQRQRVLEAEASYEVYRDYSWFTLYGVPLRGQNLNNLSKELLREIENIKNGDLEPWYTKAVIRCFELDKIQDISSSNKIESFVDSFVSGLSWTDYLNRIDLLKKVDFSDLITFVKERFTNNFSIVYKKDGEAKDLFLIKKPNLTPVFINREVESDFCKSFVSIDIKRQNPVFGNIKDFQEWTLGKSRKLYYSCNDENNLFDLLLYVDVGRLHSLLIHYGAEYRDFIGAGSFSPKQFQEELFKKALDLAISSSDNSTELTLSGFSEDFDFGLELLEKYILKGVGDSKGFKKFLSRIKVLRENAKNSKRAILWGGLYNYLHYGDKNPFKYYLTLRQIKHLGKNSLIKAISDVFSGKGEFFYYGPQPLDEIKAKLELFSERIGCTEVDYKKKNFKIASHKETQFLFNHYEMVQCEILFTGSGGKFKKELLPVIHVFNEYFGGGMDSVVFQEIRERRGLAYSAYANYTIPRDSSENFMFNFYVGTQGDKAVDAIRCVLGLLECFPRSLNYFNAIKSGILKNIESEGVKDSDLYYILKDARRYGIDMDPREYVFSLIKDVNLEDLEDFYKNYIANLKLHLLLLGDKDIVDLEGIEDLLTVKMENIKLKTIFGY